MLKGSTEFNKHKEQKMSAALRVLDNQLSVNRYVNGSELTLADISIINGVEYLTVAVEYYIAHDFTSVAEWQSRLRDELSYHQEVCEEGFKTGQKVHQEKSLDVVVISPLQIELDFYFIK